MRSKSLLGALAAVALAAAAADGGAAEPFRCQATDIAGAPAADAGTAVDIVCRELASVSGSSGSYVVSIRPLGSSLVLTVAHAGAADGRSLVLDGFSEVPTAARRLADAVALGRPIEDTRRVDNLVQSEGRKLVTQPGSTRFEMGAVGMAADRGAGTGAGFSLGFGYDSPAFAIPAEMCFAYSSDGQKTVSLFSIDTGGRYFFSRRAASPFAGGGLSMLHLSYTESRDARPYPIDLSDSHWGPGLYAETGVQLFRLHRGRMTARLRADFPLYSLHPEGFDYRPPGRSVPIGGEARYLVPITFGLTASF
jgi:hypothetical protein